MMSTSKTKVSETDPQKSIFVSDYYFALLRRIEFRLSCDTPRFPKAIGVTSCAPREGVSSIAANIALAAAKIIQGRILLVDANLDFPSVDGTFKVHSNKGLLHILRGEEIAFDCVLDSHTENLSLLLTGKARGASPAAYDSESIEELLDSLKHVFQLIIVDLPPANERTTCFAWTQQLDGLLLVIEAGGVQLETIQDTVDKLVHQKANVLGTVLNKCREKSI